MGRKAWEMRIFVLFFWWMLTCSVPAPVRVPSCPKNSVLESVFDFRESVCPINSDFAQSIDVVGVTEGDEVSLLKALNMVHRNSDKFVAVLFYASWCPFSRSFGPSFSVLSSLYPSIPHFAIKESAVRPSILSKYGVHGFPTLFLLNSRMRVRYHGNRSVESVAAFYNDVTGFKNKSLDKTSLDTIRYESKHEKHNSAEQESCLFSWASSPQNLLRQETYLALATSFVLLRLLHLLYPTLLIVAHFTWRNVKLGSMLEHLLAYLKRTIRFKEPCKRSNLQGAMNARAWASKSLATVSIGEGNSSRAMPMNG